MAGLFFSNDGTMGALLAGAMTGSDPTGLSGNNAAHWAQQEGVRLQQERFKMDAFKTNQELQQQEAERRARQERTDIDATNIAARYGGQGAQPGRLTLAPAGAPVTAAGVMTAADSGASFGAQPPGQLPFNQPVKPAGPAAAGGPPDALKLDAQHTISRFTRDAKTMDEYRKARAMGIFAWAEKNGVQLSDDDHVKLQADIQGLGAYGAGAQETAAQRERTGQEIARRHFQQTPVTVEPGKTTIFPQAAQDVLGLPAYVNQPDPKKDMDFAKEVRALPGVKTAMETGDALTTARGVVARGIQTGVVAPTDEAALLNLYQRLVDPKGAVRDPDIARLLPQGLIDDVKAVLSRKFAGDSGLTKKTLQRLNDSLILFGQAMRKEADLQSAPYRQLATKTGVDWTIAGPAGSIFADEAYNPAGMQTLAPATVPGQAPGQAPGQRTYGVPIVAAAPGQPAPAAQQAPAQVAAPPQGLGSTAQPIPVNGPADVAQWVPVGAWFRGHDGAVRQRTR